MENTSKTGDIIRKLTELEREHKLRIVKDSKMSCVKGAVIEHCGQYLIVVKDGLGEKEFKSVLLHEGIHICLDHLESHSRTKAEADTRVAMENLHERR